MILKKIKKKSNNMVVNLTKISQKRKNKSTTFILKDRNSIIELMNELNTFSNFSGLKTNQTKYEIVGISCSEWGSSGTLWREM